MIACDSLLRYAYNSSYRYPTYSQTYLSTSDFFSSTVRKSWHSRGSFAVQVVPRHFEGPWPLRRRLRREPGPGRLGSRSVRLSTVPPRPSSITSTSSTTLFQKVRAARPVAALQQPNTPDAFHASQRLACIASCATWPPLPGRDCPARAARFDSADHVCR